VAIYCFKIITSLLVTPSTCGTVKTLDKSAFTGFANAGIFGKWPDIVSCSR